MSNPGPYRYEHTVVVASDKTTTRGGYYDTEGGALNGNYTDFEVGCIVSNDLGRQGYTYGQDFYYCGRAFARLLQTRQASVRR